jgi:sialate O-acetylesterase
MVVQRGEIIPIYGWSDAGIEITVEFAGEKKSIRSDGSGVWCATFSPKEAGGPYELKISGGNDALVFRDILVGDVWLCSGQSNMEWVLRNTQNAEVEMANSANAKIRHFKVPRTWASTPSDRLAGGNWVAATPETSGDFTAIGYYFAKAIYSQTGIPIGLIHSSWGGSNIESWMSPNALGITAEASRAKMQQLEADAEERSKSIKEKLSRWPNALVHNRDTADAYWNAADLDESGWMEIAAPQLWETQGLDGVDGVIWYRKTFSLTEKQAAGGITLSLARIDDSDITYINGHKIGETNLYDQVRRYKAPAEFLHAGDNQIAIRVDDTGGGGGIYSDAALMYVETADGEKISLAGKWKIKADKVTVSLMTDVNHTATALYNKMLYPLFVVPIKGVLWYQGESNADNLEEANNYGQQFQNAINDWRKSWQKPDLAFYWVQLASYNSRKDTAAGSPWAIVRAAQTAALKLPNTGQAITIDVGAANDIHPKDKKTVGNRLAFVALNKTYGKPNVRYSGPAIDACKVEGPKVILSSSDKDVKLAVKGGGDSAAGFEIAGADGVFQPANALIRDNTIIVSIKPVQQPAAVRYAWKDNPENANLVGDDGLPAGPFKFDIRK